MVCDVSERKSWEFPGEETAPSDIRSVSLKAYVPTHRYRWAHRLAAGRQTRGNPRPPGRGSMQQECRRTPPWHPRGPRMAPG